MSDPDPARATEHEAPEPEVAVGAPVASTPDRDGASDGPTNGAPTASSGDPDGVGDPEEAVVGDPDLEGATPASAPSGGRGSSREPREAPPPPPPPDRVEGAVEALLLAAGEALSADRIRDLLSLPSALPVRDAVEALRRRWAEAGLSVEIQDVAGGHRVVTRPQYAEYVRRLWRRPAVDRLSPALLETLSIVAYRQPVARAEIERIRGVACGDALRHLLERRLVKVAGRSDQPGRPLLYATTVRFLEVFGLGGLEDLPSAKDLARL